MPKELTPLKPNLSGIKRQPEPFKIKTGEKGQERSSQGGKSFRPPAKLHRIKVAYPYLDSNGQFVEVEEFRNRQNPKELQVWPPSDTVEDFCISFYALYAGRALACYGDGTNAHRNIATGRKTDDGEEEREWRDVPCDRNTCQWAKPGKGGATACKLHMKTAFCLHGDKVFEVAPVGVLRSTSLLTHDNITSRLEAMRAITGGLLRGLPMTLVHYATEFGRHSVEVLRLEYRGTYQDLADWIVARKRQDDLMESARGGVKVEMPKTTLDPARETPEEQADVADEFANQEDEQTEREWTCPGGPTIKTPLPIAIPMDATEDQERAAMQAKPDKFDVPPVDKGNKTR